MAVESQIGKQIREVLATSLRRDQASIKPEHSLREDLGLDSLMTFELLYELEKAFDMEIPNDDLPGLQTLDDVVKYVEGRVNPSAKTKPSKPKATTPAATKAVTASKDPKTTRTPKAKTVTPGKQKKPTATAKSRSASSSTKPRSKTPSPKRSTMTTVARTKSTATAKTKAKKK